MRKVLVYWTCNRIAKRKIQKRFNLIEHTSVNGETECTVHDDIETQFFQKSAQNIEDGIVSYIKTTSEWLFIFVLTAFHA